MNQFPLSFQINLGIGKNPVLTITDPKIASQTITTFLKQQSLPSTYYQPIFQRISPFIQPQTSKSPIKLNCLRPTNPNVKRGLSPLSPLCNTKTSASKILNSKSPINKQNNIQNKQNNKNFTNIVKQSRNYFSKSPISSTNKSQISIHRPQVNRPKTPIKTVSSPLNKENKVIVKSQNQQLKIRNLFHKLTRNNPIGLNILSPQYITLRGFQRYFLQIFQQFLGQLQEEDFDIMTQQYFVKRVQQMGYKLILSKF